LNSKIDNYIPKLLNLLKDSDVERPVKIRAIGAIGDSIGNSKSSFE